MLAMSAQPPADAGERSVDWWRKTRNPAWLIAALANAPETDLPELLQAAQRIPSSAPAFESVVYYATSREIARGHAEEARRWADRALSHNLLRSSRNLISALRTRTARDWSEFLKFGLRRREPEIVEFEGSETEAGTSPMPLGTAPVFDWDVIRDFNGHVPLVLWVDASGNTHLPGDMQLRVAEAGWVRAVLLGKDEDARKLMQRVLELQPEAAKVANGFLAAHDPEEARFAALFIILRSPALRPALQVPQLPTPNLAAPHYVSTDAYGYKTGCWIYPQEQRSSMNSGFLTADQLAAGEAEWKQIQAAESWDATYLARQTLEWARKHPDDLRLPEALHRAVMASRWRCTDAETGKYAQQAFALLHQRYPKSSWAERTPYWYK